MKITITDDEIRNIVAEYINENYFSQPGLPLVKPENLNMETIYDSFYGGDMFSGYSVDLSKV